MLHRLCHGWTARPLLALLTGLALLLSALPAGLHAQGGAVPRDGSGRPLYRPGEVLVELQSGLPASALGGQATRLMQAGRTQRLGGPDAAVHRMDLAPGATMADALQALRNDPAVKAADPNYLNYPLFTTNDPDYSSQWALSNTGQTLSALLSPAWPTHNPGTVGTDIDAPGAWDLGYTGAGVLVGVVDEGVNYNHADLAANMADTSAFTPPSANHGYDYAGASSVAPFVPDDDPAPIALKVVDSHGSHVSGIVAAVRNNSAGGVGVAFGASLVALKVFPDDGAGASDDDIISAIAYAQTNSIPIVNMSIGRSGGMSTVMRDAIASAIGGGTLFVVAAGNGGADGVGDDNDLTPMWPANFAVVSETAAGVISVAASDQSDGLASFSNYGATSVTIAAPGVNIYSTVNDDTGADNYDIFAGTSMASPVVAGVAALVKQANPTFTPAQIKERIVDSGELLPLSVGCVIASGKRVNAYNAVTGTLTPRSPCGAITALSSAGSGGFLGKGGCLITWLTADYLPRRALDPLRVVREWLWRSGPWGQQFVRGYYHVSAAAIAWMEAARAALYARPVTAVL